MHKYTLSLILLTFLLFPLKVFAFVDEGFYSTISFGIKSTDVEGLEYDPEAVVGASTYEAILSKNMDLLTNDGYKRRIYNHYQYVAVPPFSQIDIGYFWFNNTPNTVNVEKIRIPMSREIQYMGDLTTLLYDIGFQEGVTESNLCNKGGKYLEVEGVGLVDSDMGKNPKNGIVIETLTVRPPVEITKYEIEYFNEYSSCRILLHVRNNTEEYLKDITLNYRPAVNRTLDLEPNEEKVEELYKQCTLTGNELDCGSIRIIDNNTKARCAVYGSPWGEYLDPNSITVFNKINGEWIAGAKVQPTVESFCIQRIPYKYTTEDMIVYLEPPEPPEPEKTTEQYWKELLNIDVLPITGKQFNILDKYLALLKPFRIDNLKVL
jgi:hypothetical protein